MCAALAGEAISSEANVLRNLTHSVFESLWSAAANDALVSSVAAFKLELRRLKRRKSVFPRVPPVNGLGREEEYLFSFEFNGLGREEEYLFSFELYDALNSCLSPRLHPLGPKKVTGKRKFFCAARSSSRPNPFGSYVVLENMQAEQACGLLKINVNLNTHDEVCQFIDKVIYCSSEDISDDFVELQTHKHSHTCQKRIGNTDECRFNIPYSPIRQTLIFTPLPNDIEDNIAKKYKGILFQIKEKLNDEKTLKLNYNQFLESLGITEIKYFTVIRSTLRTPQIFIRRAPMDIFISSYSPKILTLMRSNMNLQFVLDAYGAACYIIDYINKSSRGMSKIMRDILQEIRNGNDSLQQSLRKVSNTFYNNSELSIQEAVYNILQLPLSRSSEECIFIPTFPPTDRVHLVKKFLENATLADFAANYRYATRPGPNYISLLNKSGYIFQKKQPRVIRFRNYHFEIDPESFLRDHVMSYIPWRNEKAYILNQDLELLFHNNKDKIQQNKQKYNSYDEKALFNAVEDAKQRIATDEEEFDKSIDLLLILMTFLYKMNIQLEFQEDYTSHVSFTPPVTLPEIDYQDLITKLNQEQRDYIMHVTDTFEKTNDQLLHFLTGGAGVGKSLVLWPRFQVYQLKCIMRQTNIKFQTALNHVAKGKLKKHDTSLFNSRSYKSLPKHEDFTDAYHLFGRNDDVDNYNKQIMRKLKGKLIRCGASDVIRGHGSQLAQPQILHTVSTKTMGIPKSLPLKVNGK
ncbi:Fumarate hydratase, mitochondrial [Frankliniella fusca]|uniref:Fumarate hydratase, mitochondrial n=1 Tax=Frankliniella fusca TaxID=407009 RepID=A0AAE1HDG0_9NEOP|nr:Fumarate hydratase, mitochondrial [Frankliniella fusca]